MLPGRKRSVEAAAAGGLSDLIHLSVLLITQICLAQSVVWEQQLEMGSGYFSDSAELCGPGQAYCGSCSCRRAFSTAFLYRIYLSRELILPSCVARGKHRAGAAARDGHFRPHFSSLLINQARFLAGGNSLAWEQQLQMGFLTNHLCHFPELYGA